MRWPVVVLALAIGLVVSACGVNARARIAPITQLDTLRAAYAATRVAATARVEISVTYYDVRPPQRVTGRGTVDLRDQRFHLELHGPENTTAQLRQIGSLRYRYQTYGNVSLRPWTKTNVALVLRNQPAYVLNHQATDPVLLLGYLRGLSGQVQRVGKARLAAGTATRYRAWIDLVELSHTPGIWEVLGPLVRERMRADRIPVDLWTGRNGRIAQLRIKLPLEHTHTAGRNHGEPRFQATVRLLDYGIPVRITHPPQGAVEDITPRVSAIF